MTDRRTMVKHHAKEYQRASKGKKSRVLDVFVEATGCNRTYAARVLRRHGQRIWLKPGLAVEGDIGIRTKRCRRKVYAEVVGPLKRIWECLDYLCGKRMARALPGALEALERHGELHLPPEVRARLLRISAATIDCLLAPPRSRTGPPLPDALSHRQPETHRRSCPPPRSIWPRHRSHLLGCAGRIRSAGFSREMGYHCPRSG